VKKLDRSLTPGGAALILLVPKVTLAKVLPYLQRYGGEIIQSSLNQEREAQLHEALQPVGAAATPVAPSVPRQPAARPFGAGRGQAGDKWSLTT
jgi:hypothetical protein